MIERWVPQDVSELADALREAVRAGRTVEILGLGARADWGNPLPAERVGISTAGLTRVVDYAPDDMVVTAEAGLSLAELNELLATRRQVLPLEVPFPERTTLGGLVAAAPVPLGRAGYGLVRDWLLGLEVVSSEGDVIKSGARVVKSVAGYDLCKLYTGSLGTLGAISSVTFRVRPMPETRCLLSARWTDAAQAEAALAALQTTSLDPAIALLGADADGFTFSLGFDGSNETVAWQADEARRLLTGLGGGVLPQQEGEQAERERAELRDALAGRPEAPLVVRVSVLPSELLSFVCEAQVLGASLGVACTAIAQVLQGTVWLSADGDEWLAWVEQLRARAHGKGGSLVIERCPVPESLDAFGLDGTPLALMRRLKASLDPAGSLAPGRLWPLREE
ncbi:FAD-binding oxidoreductase [bacterium]|nr:FAD-binding oxidoreductase [bacterium]